MKHHSFRMFFTASLLLLDICGLALAFELAYRARFLWPAFLNLFPVTRGIPDIALYHGALRALLPVLGFFLALLALPYGLHYALERVNDWADRNL